MPALFSPIANPATWSFDNVSKTLPDGLRYSGYIVRAVAATIGASENVRLPGLSILKKVTGADEFVYVDLKDR